MKRFVLYYSLRSEAISSSEGIDGGDKANSSCTGNIAGTEYCLMLLLKHVDGANT